MAMTSGAITRRALFGLAGCLLLAGCAADGESAAGGTAYERESSGDGPSTTQNASGDVTPGTETYRGFVLDNVLHDAALGDVHFHLHMPDFHGDSSPAALFVTLPGYQGLYFQGVGVNLETEDFGFTAQEHDPNMIVAAPQLEDWGAISADKTVALVEHLMGAYVVDPSRVYLEGYSGGGETLSLVMERAPDLFAAALHCASQWDGDLAPVAGARVPVRLVVGGGDEYYGPEPDRAAAEELRGLYRERGLPEEEIDQLVVLDVKPASYFEGVSSQHGGGAQIVANDEEIMEWLFGHFRP